MEEVELSLLSHEPSNFPPLPSTNLIYINRAAIPPVVTLSYDTFILGAMEFHVKIKEAGI